MTRYSPLLCRSGFTLVEMALTAMIIGLGILTVLGLARHGGKNALRAADDSRAALFADSAFATLHAINDTLRYTGKSNQWERFWQDFRDGETNLSTTCADFWADATNLLMLVGDGEIRTNRFLSAAPCRSDSGVERIPEQTIRYRLLLDIDETNRYTKVNLHIWPSSYGLGDKAILFYTHFVGEEPLK